MKFRSGYIRIVCTIMTYQLQIVTILIANPGQKGNKSHYYSTIMSFYHATQLANTTQLAKYPHVLYANPSNKRSIIIPLLCHFII